jgi:XTP/dITP diphosphohydrolase
MNLILSTRNEHKVHEIRAILAIPGLVITALTGVPDAPEVEEDGETFEANAIKKARVLAQHTGMWTMADDSGLEVDALDGDPGVRSARYAGEPVDYEANNRKLLNALTGEANRRARFRCVIALCDPDGEARTVEGRCEGAIAEAARGTGGFGYDPVFIPEGFARTFAEMPAELKNAISHRGLALQAAIEAWSALLTAAV